MAAQKGMEIPFFCFLSYSATHVVKAAGEVIM
jgi:hypothetical protein